MEHFDRLIRALGLALAVCAVALFAPAQYIPAPMPYVAAKANLLAQGANISNVPLYTVPANAAGMYRVSCYVVLTQAATVSSTLPDCITNFTDADTSAASSIWTVSNLTANTVGTNSLQATMRPLVFNAKGGSAIGYQTTNYASSGATPMQYAIHVRVEYLGK